MIPLCGPQLHLSEVSSGQEQLGGAACGRFLLCYSELNRVPLHCELRLDWRFLALEISRLVFDGTFKAGEAGIPSSGLRHTATSTLLHCVTEE